MDKNPFMLEDGLTMYFNTQRPGGPLGGTDIWVATRASIDSLFVVQGPELSLSTDTIDGHFELAANELVGVLASTRLGGVGGYDLWSATRSDLGAPFTVDQTHLANVNTSGGDQDPHLTTDLLQLYFAREEAAGASLDILVASRSQPDLAFEPAQPLAGFATTLEEADPVVSPDQRVIVFTTNMNDAGRDIFFATRSEPAEPFSSPQVVPGVNSTASDQDTFLSRDGCELWFGSTRGAAGDWDVFVSRIVPE